DSFYRQYFQLDAIPMLDGEHSKSFAAFAAGTHVGEPGHDLRADAIQEVMDLARYYTWTDPKGGYDDLLLSRRSVTASRDLASLYGVAPATPNGPAVEFPEGQRAGFFTRVAFHMTGNERTHPFVKGSH